LPTKLIHQQHEYLGNFKNLAIAHVDIENRDKNEYESNLREAKVEFTTHREKPNTLLLAIGNKLVEAKNYLSTDWIIVIKKSKVPSPNLPKKVNDPERLLEDILKQVERKLKKITSLQWNYVHPLKTTLLFGGIFFVVGIILLAKYFVLNKTTIWVNAVLATGIGIFIARHFAQLQINRRKKPYEKLLQLGEQAKIVHSLCINPLEQRYHDKVKQLQDNYTRKKIKIKNNFDKIWSQTQPSVVNFCKVVDQSSPSWTDPSWNNFKPTNQMTNIIRFGSLKYQLNRYELEMPTFFLFPGNKSILFKGSGDLAKEAGVEFMQSLMLKFLVSIPPSQLRFTFFDPIAVGQNVTPFMALGDYDELLITSKVWIESNHFEKELIDLIEHIGNVIQKYLRNQFTTIEEFNEQAGEVAEAYRILVVMDFPTNFNEDTIRRLLRVIQNGPRCGVYTFIYFDRTKRLPYGVKENEIYQGNIIFNWQDNRFIWEDENYTDCEINYEPPPPEQLFSHIIKQVGETSQIAKQVKVPIDKLLEKSNLESANWWKHQTAEGITAPLGIVGAQNVQLLDLGKDTRQHVLIGGISGGGKSTLLHVLINTLALKYDPNELEFYLIDFKVGIEFKIYATEKLPHAKVIAIASEREFGLSVLEKLDHLITQRGELFKKHGTHDIKTFREKTDLKIPRILLLIDEFQEFFTEDDAIASKASLKLDRFSRQGRAFGIHLIMGSQTLAGVYTLARSTIDQMAVRIVLASSEADSRLILSDDNTAARTLNRPGQAIYNSTNGTIEGNNPFQVAWLNDDQKKFYLSNIRNMAIQRKIWPPKSQIVFDGNAPGEIENNTAFNTFMKKNYQPEPFIKTDLWLGEPIAIKDATIASFQRQSGSHLLIVGQNVNVAMGLFITNILCLAGQYSTQNVHFYILDFNSVATVNLNYFQEIEKNLNHKIVYGKRKQLTNIISTISKETMNRTLNENNYSSNPLIFLFIFGLQRAKDLHDDDDFIITPENFLPDNQEESISTPVQSIANQFKDIILNGPEYGIHIIIWCDSNSNLNRILDRTVIRELELRVLFQMSEDDSINLIESPAANKIGQHRALFFNLLEGSLEKFRPFSIPSEKWLRDTCQIISSKRN